MILKYLIIHMISLFVLVLGFFLADASDLILSVLCGGLVMGLNVSFLIWVGRRIFMKKSIALGAFLIVTKYSILGTALFILSQQEDVNLFFVAIGTLAFIPALGVFAFRYPRLEDEVNGSL